MALALVAFYFNLINVYFLMHVCAVWPFHIFLFRWDSHVASRHIPNFGMCETYDHVTMSRRMRLAESIGDPG